MSEGADKKNVPGRSSTTTTTMPATQPTIPPDYGAPTPGTTVPSTPTPGAGSRISPSLQNQNILVEGDTDPYRYAIGVKGRIVYDINGNIKRYEGYKYTGPGSPTGGGDPKYFSGDEDQIANFGVEDIASLQKAMNAVGLLSDDYAPGIADYATRSAYNRLLGEANVYAEDTNAAILRLASAGAGRRKGQLTQYRVSNEKDVKSIISRVAKQTIGRNLGEGDLNRLAQLYRNLEKETGLAAGSETQQEVMAAPSPETFTQSKLEEMFPEETNARQFGSYLEALQERYQL